MEMYTADDLFLSCYVIDHYDVTLYIQNKIQYNTLSSMGMAKIRKRIINNTYRSLTPVVFEEYNVDVKLL